MKNIQVIILLFLVVTIQGCSTPQVVKSLSTEQVGAQKSSVKTMKQYFALMEQVLSRQVINSKAEEDRHLQKEIQVYRDKYKNGLKDPEANKDELLKELSNNIRTATQVTGSVKKSYDTHFSEFKTTHVKILKMLDTMVLAQETINSYIQIEKTDEVLGNTLFSLLGKNKAEVKKYTSGIQTILTSMEANKEE